MILIPTVRHTGSHFVVGLFGLTTQQAISLHQQTGDPSEVMFEHVDTNELDYLLKLAENNTMIIPLRHPKVTAQSWLARNKCTIQMSRDFRTLVNRFDPLNPYYLPLDVEDKQDYLDVINEDLGLELKTDWNPTGRFMGNNLLRHEDCLIDVTVKDLCEEIKPFLDRFYAS